MAVEALTDDKWPHKPSDYEWKGTLNQSGETWTVLAYCKAKGTDVIVKSWVERVMIFVVKI